MNPQPAQQRLEYAVPFDVVPVSCGGHLNSYGGSSPAQRLR